MQQQTNQQAPMDVRGAQQLPVVTGEDRKEILEQRKLLIDLQNQSTQSFDKMIVALAGGALTVSIAFIRQTVPEALPGTTWSLATAWFFLTVTLFTSLFSHFTSQFAMMKMCDELDRAYLGVVAPPQKSSTGFLQRTLQSIEAKGSNLCKHRMTTHWLNVAAIICCVLGIGFLALFVVLNFPQLQVPLPK